MTATVLFDGLMVAKHGHPDTNQPAGQVNT